MILRYCVIFVFIIPQKNAFRTFIMNGMETVLAVHNETITFECNNNMAMAYCGFIHPNGTRFTFTGPEVNAGRCSIKITVTTQDNGLWRCHFGSKIPGLEIVQVKSVRVSDRLAAIQQNVTSVHGRDVTLYCTTTESMVSLSYCRFEAPSGNSFSIGPAATAIKPVMKRYYFPENKSLDRGDCAVTIHKVSYEDVGTWTCGAGLNDLEITDRIKLHVEGFYAMTAASATAIGIGAALLLIFIVILTIVIWNKRVANQRAEETAEEIEVQDLGQSQHVTPHSSPRAPRVVVQSPFEVEFSASTSRPTYS